MSNRDEILGFLNRIAPDMASNADIVSHTGIKPNQQVFQITQTLLNKELIKGRRNGREWRFASAQKLRCEDAIEGRCVGVSLADRIRQFTLNSFILSPHRSKNGTIKIRAGDVHSAMHLHSRMPAVCSALESKKFQEHCGLELIRRAGPQQGANALFTFSDQPAIPQEVKSQSKVTNRKILQRKALKKPSVTQTDSNAVYFVSCVKSKRETKAPAKDLYISDWFTKARAFVESTGSTWWILSAKYGLLPPGKYIHPYELTLNKMGVEERRRWSRQVIEEFGKIDPAPARIVMLAGMNYREFLLPELQKRGIKIDIPMEGLAFGEQLNWLGSQAAHG